MSDNLDIIVQAKLDQSAKAVQKLKNDISSLEKKIKNTKIKLNVELDNTAISKLEENYTEFNRLSQKEYTIKKSILATDKKHSDLLKQKLALIRSAQDTLKSQVNTDKKVIYNEQYHNQLLQNRQKLETDLIAKQQTLAQKEDLRLKKLGTLMSGVNTTGLKFDDAGAVRNFVQDIIGGNTEISKMTPKIIDANNRLWEFATTTKTVNNNVKEEKYTLDQATGSMYKHNEAIRQDSSKSLSFVQQMGQAIKNTVTCAFSTDLLNYCLNALKDGIQIIKDLDSELTQVSIITGMTTEETKELSLKYVELSKDMGRSISEISKINTELVKQGLSTAESMSRIQTVIKLSTTTGMNTNEASSFITSSENIIGEDTEKIADVMLKAGQISTSSATEIGEALTKTASSAKATGISIEELSAIFSTLVEVTQEDPSLMADSLEILLERFTAINEVTGEVNNDFNKIQTAFNNVGITSTNATGQIKPMYELLQELSLKWKDLDKNAQMYMSTQIAGANQARIFSSIMNNFNNIQSKNNSLIGAGGTLNQSYSQYLNSVEASANKAKASFEEMWLKALDSDVIKDFYDASIAITTFIGNVGVLRVALTTLATIILLNNKTFKDFSTNISINIMNQFKSLKTGATQTATNITKVGTTSTVASESLMAGFAGATMSTKLLKIGVIGLKAAITGGLSIAISFIVEKIMGLIAASEKSKQKIEELKQSVKSNIQTYQSNIRILKSIQKEYDTLNEKIGKNRDLTKLTTAEQERYKSLVEQIAQIVPEAVSYDDNGQAIIAYTTQISTLIKKQNELSNLENKKLLTEESDIIKNSSKLIKDKKSELEELQFQIEEYKIAANPDPTVIEDTVYLPSLRMKSAGDLNAELNKLLVDQEILINDIKKEKANQIELLDIHFLQIDNKDEINNSLKQFAKTKIYDIYDKEGYYEATEALGTFLAAYDQLIESRNANTTEESNRKLELAKNIFDDLGLSTEEVNSIIFKFNNNIKTTDEVLSTLPGSITTNIDAFKELINVITNLENMFSKLASGKELSSNELIDLVDKYEEVAKYIAQTSDLSLDNGEILKNIINSNVGELQDKYELEMQTKNSMLISARKSLEEQEENLIKIKEELGEGSNDYKQQKDLVENTRNTVNDRNTQFLDAVNTLKSLDIISTQSSKNSEIDGYIQNFKFATSKLKKYKDVLKEINANGVLSSDTNKEIIQEHSELIYYLGQEGDMRTYLMSLIDDYSAKQIEAYKNALLASDKFSKHILNNNEDLFRNISKLYDIDLENFTTVQNLKEQMKSKDIDVLSPEGKETLNPFQSEKEKISAELAVIDDVMRYYSTDSITRHNYQGALKYVNTTSIADLIYRQNQLKSELELIGINEKELEDIFDPDELFNDFNTSSNSNNYKKDLQKIEPIELSIDRYIKYNKAIEEVERSIEANSQFIDLATNKDKLTFLSKEIDLLKEKQNILHLTANEYRREKDELSAILSKKINLNDGTMGIDSFNEYTQQVQKSINSFINQINNSSTNSIRDNYTEQKNNLQNEYDKVKDFFDRYLEVQTQISDYSSNWWQIEKEKFTQNMAILETDLEKYSKEIERINDKLTLRITVKEDSIDQIEKDFELMKNMADIYKLSLSDIDVKITDNDNTLTSYENKMKTLDNVNNNEEYAQLSNYIVMTRSEQDKLLAEEKKGVSALKNLLENSINNYIKQLNYSKEKTKETLQDTRKIINTFNDNAFQNSTEEILTDLNKIDEIYVINADVKLSTNNAREELRKFSNFYSSKIEEINSYQEEVLKTMSIQTNTQQEQEDNKNNLLNLIEKQINMENELKDLEVEQQNEIDKLTVSYKRNEDALENMITTKQKELDQLQEQFDQEDKTKEMLEKQIELLRVMDDERYSYITGMGEEVFTYDQSKVTALQEELAEMKQENEREAMINALQDEISQMKEDLTTTKEIHKQELEVLKLTHKSIENLVSEIGENIDDNMKENGLDKIYKDMSNIFINGIKEVFKPILEKYNNHSKKNIDRSTINNVVDKKNINQEKLKPNTDTLQQQDKSQINQYIIKPTDTLYKIAQRCNTSVNELLKLNPQITNPNLIYPNQKINIPKFNTGGYTGEWGTEGRLGILHEKELILNKDDTINVLNSIDLAKGIFDNLTQVDRVIGQSCVTHNKEHKSIILNNPVFNGVNDVNKFVNELNGLFRRGMPSIS